MSFWYTINGKHCSRSQALEAYYNRDVWHNSADRGVSRTFRTHKGVLTVWVWPFQEQES